MNKKRLFALLMAAALATTMTACGSKDNGTNGSEGSAAYGDAGLGEISVVSREDGSGTRGAFVELTGVEVKDADGHDHRGRNHHQ